MVTGPVQSPPPRGERATVLFEHLRGRIEAGLIQPGARLPSVRQFATDWGVSRFTAVEAYDRLVAAGWVEARRGSGFYARMPGARAEADPAQGAEPLPNAPDPSWLLRAMLRTSEVSRAPGAGLVPPEWLNQEITSRALRTAARNEGAAMLYGHPQGFPELRTALARRLGDLGIDAPPEGILTTVGATQALDLVARELLRPGDTAIVDDPAFFLPFAQFAALGVRVVGVPWREDGPDLAALETLLAAHRPKLYLTTSSLHNPTGSSLAPSKAFRVLKLAEAAGTWIIEDDVWGDFALHPSPRLAALDGLQRVIHVGSFTKALSPGWRVGYLAAPPELMPRLVDRKLLSGVTTPQPTEAAVAAILQDGAYRRHVARLQERVARARVRALKSLSAAGFTPAEPAGEGLFVWTQLGCDAHAFGAELYKQGILAAPGHLFSPSATSSTWMRVNVAAAEYAPLMTAMAATRARLTNG